MSVWWCCVSVWRFCFAHLPQETQTENGSLYPPFPNTNPGWTNTHLSPIATDNNFLRNPSSNGGSRTRLSGVSNDRERPTSQPEAASSPKPFYNRSPSDPARPSLPGNTIPRLQVSDDSVVSDDEDMTDDSITLRISEGDETTPFMRKQFSESGRFDTGVNSLSNYDDIESQTSGVDGEESRHIPVYCADVDKRYGRRCSETLSWNERGSPEQLVQQNGFDLEDNESYMCNHLEDNRVNFDNIYNLTNCDFQEDKPSTPV